jgi:arsenical pump membrane protein
VFMANAASLLLPGSNLTNLLVLHDNPQNGAAFCRADAARLAHRLHDHRRVHHLRFRPEDNRAEPGDAPPLQPAIGAIATLAAALLVVALPNPALPVLAIGLAATGLRRMRPRLDTSSLALLFTLTSPLAPSPASGTSRPTFSTEPEPWPPPASVQRHQSSSNNLPAAVLLSAQPPTHPDALLLGLNLGPNLAVTGSLSAVLWLQAARDAGARASIATYTRLGLTLVPLSLAATVAALLAHL